MTRAFFLCWVALVARQVVAEPASPAATANVDIIENLGEPIPQHLPFIDASGRTVELGNYLRGRPVILTLVYYHCPVLCSRLLGGLTKSMQTLAWHLGREYDAVTVSIDPDETPTDAARARDGFIQSLGQTDPPPAWAFLTGRSSSIDALAAAVGFRYHAVASDGRHEYAHAAAIYVLTPDGHLSRYLYGIDFPSRQLSAALFEAADGRVGTSFERLILRCYRYDPTTRRYELFIARYFRFGGVVLLLLVGGLLATLWRRELRR